MRIKTKHMATTTSPLPLPLFPICLSAASVVGTDPLITFSLVIDHMTNRVSGMVEMKKKSEPNTTRFPVTGTIYELVFGADVTLVVNVSGEYEMPLPGTDIGHLSVPFSAFLNVDKNWNGKGTIRYGRQMMQQAIVTKIACSVPNA